MRFDNLSELRQAVMNVIFHMKTDQFMQIFDDWVRRHKNGVELKGHYVKSIGAKSGLHGGCFKH
jgi:hypothetical protein